MPPLSPIGYSVTTQSLSPCPARFRQSITLKVASPPWFRGGNGGVILPDARNQDVILEIVSHARKVLRHLDALSLGAVNTPKVLMQSGIGDERELTRAGPRNSPWSYPWQEARAPWPFGSMRGWG